MRRASGRQPEGGRPPNEHGVQQAPGLRRLLRCAVVAAVAVLAGTVAVGFTRAAFGLHPELGWPDRERVALDEGVLAHDAMRASMQYDDVCRSRVRTCGDNEVRLWLESEWAADGASHPDLEAAVRREVAANEAALRRLQRASAQPYWSCSAAAVRDATAAWDIATFRPAGAGELSSLARLACAEALLISKDGDADRALVRLQGVAALGVAMTHGALPEELVQSSGVVGSACTSAQVVLAKSGTPRASAHAYALAAADLRGRIWPLEGTVRLEAYRTLRQVDLISCGGARALAPYYGDRPSAAWPVLACGCPAETRRWISDRYERITATCDGYGAGTGFEALISTMYDDGVARRDYLAIATGLNAQAQRLSSARRAWVRMADALDEAAAAPQ